MNWFGISINCVNILKLLKLPAFELIPVVPCYFVSYFFLNLSPAAESERSQNFRHDYRFCSAWPLKIRNIILKQKISLKILAKTKNVFQIWNLLHKLCSITLSPKTCILIGKQTKDYRLLGRPVRPTTWKPSGGLTANK